MLSTEMTTSTKCQHTFHSKCLQPILSDNKPCPLCRAPLTDVDEGKDGNADGQTNPGNAAVVTAWERNQIEGMYKDTVGEVEVGKMTVFQMMCGMRQRLMTADAVKGLLRAQASVNDDAEVQEFLHDSDEEGDSNCVYEGAAGGTMTTAIE